MADAALNSKNQTSRIVRNIAAAALCRLLVNTARRFVYPFAPALSRGLGVPLTAITSLIAVNQITGVLGMFFGPVTDRVGYRVMMISGLGVLSLGMLAGGILPFYGVILVALFLAGLGKNVFDPALQSYIGAQVPFHKRGRFVGITELSWAGSTLVGIPLIGVLIDQYGWRSSFFALGAGGLIGILVLGIFIPRERTGTTAIGSQLALWKTWTYILKKRTALGAIGYGFLFGAANDNLFVVYGAWLETSFQLSIMGIGIGTGIIGIAEMAGEFLTAAVSDKFGLKRSIFVGLILSLISYALLPFLGQTLPLALGGLFFIFLAVEFTIVTFLSLLTELIPEARATMISCFFALSGLGRVAGAFTGGFVWMAGGILAIGLVSAGIIGIAMIAIAWGLKNWRKM